MKPTNQGSHHMAIRGVVVITGPIEIGGHQADRIKAVLLPQGLTQLDPSNLGNRVPLVGGLQGSFKESLLLDWLLSKFGINATASQEQQAWRSNRLKATDVRNCLQYWLYRL